MEKVENPVELIVDVLREEDKVAEVLAGLKDIAELMGSGRSAIITAIEDEWVGQLVDDLEKEGAKIIRQELKDEVAYTIATGTG